ncbi:MAG: hypothetical protein INH41_25875 [Myxococcaceae bacterium]|jgi:hypothetical protein|nr:hypothetical protein [Myxococcaceae bacterium]MCA3015831.1 hypothetical protein [Myxococcaceae bacterium]
MGTLKNFLESKQLSAKQVHTTSKRIETWDAESRTLLVKRVAKRADKERAAKKYDELNLAKPKQMGRGVTEKQVQAAIEDKPVARKVRSKILRAVNTLLTSKKESAVDMKTLFEGTKHKAGKKPKEEAKK